MITVAVDAMGGDDAPGVVVAGAQAYAREDPEARVLLVGQPDRLKNTGLEVVPASEVIAADEAPAAAIRRKRDSSIVVGLGLVKGGRARAFVSAGNTGALMAGSLIILGRIPGVDRPAMTSILPTIDGEGFLLLDLGAHMDASARNLYEYAVMGSLYAELVRGIDRPRIGLLNVGTEEGKGNEVSREAYSLLADSDLNFVGNVESRELFTHTADVVVSDGFVGNVLLKAVEGYGMGVVHVLGHELRHSGLQTLLGAFLARNTLWRLKKRIDWTEYGGAPLLGVDGISIKCHGSADARVIRNGIHLAATFARQSVIERIGALLSREGDGGDV